MCLDETPRATTKRRYLSCREWEQAANSQFVRILSLWVEVARPGHWLSASGFVSPRKPEEKKIISHTESRSGSRNAKADLSCSPWNSPEPGQPVLALCFLPNQQALILPLHLINTHCQIWFAVGLELRKDGARGRSVSSDATGASTLNPTVLLCAAQPCVIQSISFDQNCQLRSCHTLTTAVCVSEGGRERLPRYNFITKSFYRVLSLNHTVNGLGG